MNCHFWLTFCIYYFYSHSVSHVGQPPESTLTRAASAFHWTQYRRDSCGYLDKIYPFLTGGTLLCLCCSAMGEQSQWSFQTAFISLKSAFRRSRFDIFELLKHSAEGQKNPQ